MKMRTFTCTVCGTDYKRALVMSNFCDKCRKLIPVQKAPEKRVCKECEKPFTPRQRNQIFCSPICKNRDYNREHDIPGMMREIRERGKQTMIAKLKKKRSKKKAAVS